MSFPRAPYDESQSGKFFTPPDRDENRHAFFCLVEREMWFEASQLLGAGETFTREELSTDAAAFLFGNLALRGLRIDPAICGWEISVDSEDDRPIPFRPTGKVPL